MIVGLFDDQFLGNAALFVGLDDGLPDETGRHRRHPHGKRHGLEFIPGTEAEAKWGGIVLPPVKETPAPQLAGPAIGPIPLIALPVFVPPPVEWDSSPSFGYAVQYESSCTYEFFCEWETVYHLECTHGGALELYVAAEASIAAFSARCARAIELRSAPQVAFGLSIRCGVRADPWKTRPISNAEVRAAMKKMMV